MTHEQISLGAATIVKAERKNDRDRQSSAFYIELTIDTAFSAPITARSVMPVPVGRKGKLVFIPDAPPRSTDGQFD